MSFDRNVLQVVSLINVFCLRGKKYIYIYIYIYENVETFIYMYSILNADNKMNIEIAEGIAKCNKEYCANSKTNNIKITEEKRQNENT